MLKKITKTLQTSALALRRCRHRNTATAGTGGCLSGTAGEYGSFIFTGWGNGFSGTYCDYAGGE